MWMMDATQAAVAVMKALARSKGKPMAYVDYQGCVITVERAEVEQGPLRESDLSENERLNMPPNWAWLEHGPIAYQTRSDLRARDGSIVARGTPCMAQREGQWLYLHCDDGRVVMLDGRRYAAPSAEAPLYRLA